MTTANDVLRLAASQIGVAENPDGSNHTKFSVWYGYDAAWCNMFLNWCFYHSGMPIGPAPRGAAWVSTTADWFAAQGRYFKGNDGIRPGDLLFFEWGSTPGGYDHIAICERVEGDNIITIEGNVGNRVQRLVRHRTMGGIDAYARPNYAIVRPPKPPPKDWFEMATEADLRRIVNDELKPLEAAVLAINERLVKVENSFIGGQNPGKRDLYEIADATLNKVKQIADDLNVPEEDTSDQNKE